jgi:23S rRNA (uracil1939-C5)-methyltransferase
MGLPEQPNRHNPRQNKQRPAPRPQLQADFDAGYVEYKLLDRTFRCSSGSFFQVNLPQAAKLVELALERLNLKGNEHVLDLYSGVGLFTAFIAAAAGHVSGVESFAPAVEDAVHNLNDYTNIDLYVDTIEAALPEILVAVDAAVVDPPRAGMDAAALEALVAKQPQQIVYVSCDPATLARDAKRLVAAGYTLRDVQPVDMFPQTYHIESVAHFTL